MPALPEPIRCLAEALGSLPGIGPRSAERLALHLVQEKPARIESLTRILTSANATVTTCTVCGALTEKEPCDLCSDPRRDTSIICVVEKPTDILSLERSGAFHGRYHVLGGKISPLDGVEPEDLSIAALERRVETEPVGEIVLALGSDVEGDATCHYLAQRFSTRGLSVSRIAHGLPAGSGLDFADDMTLSRALEGRRKMDLD